MRNSPPKNPVSLVSGRPPEAGPDDTATSRLLQALRPELYRFACWLARDRAVAEDVVQEAMLRVWTYAPRWRPLALFRTWLTRVVVNLCIDRKRRAPWVELEAAGEIIDPAPHAGAKAERDERDRMVAAGIAQLPARQRAAIMLTYGDGMSNSQVAEILDTSVSAVETLLVRGKQNLRRTLGRLIDEDR